MPGRRWRGFASPAARRPIALRSRPGSARPGPLPDERDVLAHLPGRLVEGGLLPCVERQLDDALETVAAEAARDADPVVGEAVLPAEVDAAREHTLLVPED